MPLNKNAFTRYKVLDELLSNRYHNYTLDDLTDEVNNQLAELSIEPVTRRCIEKDIAYLKGENSPFLADIESYSVDVFNGNKTVKKRCVRYSDPSYSIFKKEMSSDEEYLLSEALSLLGQFDGLPNLEALERLRLGLGVRTDKKIISFTKNPLEHKNLLGELFTAISNKQVISINYETFGNVGGERNITLYPYLLKEYNRRWYLFASSRDNEKLLNFSLDRIKKVMPLTSEKYVECKEDLDEFFDDIIGVTKYADKEVNHIVFWVSDYSKDYVRTKPIHDSQIHYNTTTEASLREKYPTLEGGAFFSIDCIENYELIRELSTFGADLLVLSPKHIQKTVYEKCRLMNEKYLSIMAKK